MNNTEQPNTTKQTGLIAYFANNSVAANLMMFFIIVMGLISYFTIQRQMFPNIEVNYITVNANYPGASPQEIEESILIKIEESLKDITEIKKGVYRAFRNGGSASLEINTDAELTDVLDKVKLRVDGIATFPAGMEPVTISQIEFRQDVIGMTLVADLPLNELKPIANQVEDELLQLSNVSLVVNDVPLDEIAIEIEPDTLRQYNLTLSDVANAVRRYSANFSAGQLKTDAGVISVRVENQFYSGEEFRQIPVKIGANGAKVLLQDIATIKDQFVEGERYFKFNGENAVYLSVKATEDQNIIPVADSVKAYIDKKNKELPLGVRIEPLMDFTYYLNARLDMMKANLLQGAILVALMLSLFLRFKLALWVMIGLPVCFLGAMMLMPLFGITINIVRQRHRDQSGLPDIRGRGGRSCLRLPGRWPDNGRRGPQPRCPRDPGLRVDLRGHLHRPEPDCRHHFNREQSQIASSALRRPAMTFTSDARTVRTRFGKWLQVLASAPISAKIGMLVVGVYAFVAVFAPLIAPYGEYEVVSRVPFQPWDSEFLLGTDQLGRDFLSRLIFGARNSITVAAITTLIAFLIGTTFGIMAAVLGGFLDQVFSRIVDALMAIPDLIFILMILSIAGASIINLILIIAVLTSTRIYRIARAASLNVASLDYVEASYVRGEGLGWRIFHEILPNIMPLLISELGMRFSFVFLSIAALSFLGVGIQPPTAEWGSMVRENSALINMGDITPLIPAGAIAFLTIGINLIVDWMLNEASGLQDEN